MALSINLYHEIHRARKEERYDPLKISFMCLGLVALILAGIYLAKLSETNTVREEFAAHEAEMAKLGPQSAKAKVDEEALKTQIQKSDALSNKIEKRFYWAPVMELVGNTIPKNVQITKLVGDIGTGDASNRRIGLVLDGISGGAQPRKVAEDLRLAIIDALSQKFKSPTAEFRTLEDSVEHVNLDGADVPTALFSINISFRATGPETAPQPTTAQR
jgi:hypothetical protein